MAKRLLAILALAVFVGTVSFLGLSGAAQDVPAEFVIKSTLWKAHTKSGVKLSHEQHGIDLATGFT